jgi:hypothetical protein
MTTDVAMTAIIIHNLVPFASTCTIIHTFHIASMLGFFYTFFLHDFSAHLCNVMPFLHLPDVKNFSEEMTEKDYILVSADSTLLSADNALVSADTTVLSSDNTS